MGRTTEEWLLDYHDSHRHPTNQKIHLVCVPLIMFSLLGILFALPFPYGLSKTLFYNWSFVLIIVSLGFYFTLSFKIALRMLSFSLVQLLLIQSMYQFISKWALLLFVFLFMASWVGQFIGHKIEGKKPSFFKDLQFLLIGPLWIFMKNKMKRSHYEEV